MRALFALLLVFLMVFLMPWGRSALAEADTADADSGSSDVTTSEPAPDPGQAQITEILEGPDNENALEGSTESEQADLTYENDAIVTDPANLDGGESPKAAFDVEANKAIIDETQTTSVTNPDARNAIQKAVDEALEKIEADTKSITITVEPGTYSGDIIISSVMKRTSTTTTTYKDAAGNVLGTVDTVNDLPEVEYVIPDNFVLNIVASDAGDSLTGSAGGAKIEGNIVIDDINVLLAGLYLSLNSIVKVQSTTDGSNPEVEIYGTATDDTIQVSAEGKRDTGSDHEKAAVTVHGGDGQDTISVTAGSAADVKIYGDASDDTISVTGAADADIGSQTTVNVYGGEGCDLVNVDAQSANTIHELNVFGNSDVAASPEKDRLHLTGTLKETDTPASGITVDSVSGITTIALEHANGIISIVSRGFETYTDALVNKPTRTLTLADATASAGGYTFNLSGGSFYNYQYSASDDQVIDFTIAGGGLLTNFAIKGEGDLAIHSLQAPTANLKLSGDTITIQDAGSAIELNAANLEVTAKNVYVLGDIQTSGDVVFKASDDDVLFDVSTPQVLDDLGLDTSASGSFFDCSAGAEIVVSGSIRAGGSVDLQATTSQTKSLLDLSVGAINNGENLLADLNFLNVKVGNADIKISGTIIAGGSVSAAASSTIKFSVTGASLGSLNMPLSLSIAVTDVNVIVTGTVQAGGDINFNAESNVNINTTATTGTIPVTIAISVAVVNCHVIVGDTSIASTSVVTTGGNILISAKATTDMKTKAGRGASANGTMSGYFAVGVGVQDVSASILGNATVTAVNGSVTVNSSSVENATTEALSAKPEDTGTGEGGSQDTLSTIKTTIVNLIKKVGTSIGTKLGLVTQSIEGKDFAVSIPATTHGTVSALSKANEGDTITATVTPNKGYKVAQAYAKYLPAGSATYTTIGMTGDGTGKFTFTMPASDVTIVVTFERKTAADLGVTDAEYAGLFDEDGTFTGTDDTTTPPTDPMEEQEDDDLGLTDLFDEGTGGAGATDQNLATENSTSADAIQIETTQTDGGAILTDVTKVDAGKSVKVTINPTTDHQLKAGSLKVTYTKLDSSTTPATTGEAVIVVNANENGEFIFAMPSDVDSTKKVTLSAEWEAVPAGNTPANTGTKTSNSSIQLTGALSVAVIVNTNNALIDTTGEVRAITLNVAADGTTTSIATADATDGLEKADAAAADVPGTTAAGAVATTGAQWVAGKDRIIHIDASVNGGIDFTTAAQSKSTKDASGVYTKYAFEVAAASGYELAKDTAGVAGVTVTYTKEDGTTGTTTLALTAGLVYLEFASLEGGYKQGTEFLLSPKFVLSAGATAGTDVTIDGTYVPDTENTVMISGTTNGTINFVSSESSLTTKTYAFKVTPETGFKLDSMTTDASGTTPATTKFAITYSYTKAVAGSADTTVTVNLTADGKGNYFFKLGDLTDIKAGTSVVVTATFVEDTREVVVGDTTNGTVAIVRDDAATTTDTTETDTATPATYTAKAGDTVKFTVAAASGYKVGSVFLSYTNLAGTAVANDTASVVLENGEYHFTMPASKSGTQVTIHVTFVTKAFDVAIDTTTITGDNVPTEDRSAAGTFVSLSDTKADLGDTITVSISAAGAAKGYKISSLTIQFLDAMGTEATELSATAVKNADGSYHFVVPTGADAEAFVGGTAEGYRLTVELAAKALNVTVNTSDRGTVTASNAKADVGDVLTFTATPNAGYRITASTVSITIKKGTSSVTSSAAKQADGTFTFTVPEGTTEITVTPSFSIGTDTTASTGKSASVGVGITVAVTKHTNYASIKSGSIYAGAINVSAISGSEQTAVSSAATAKAGYSNANIGIGGAITVHVASAKTKARVYDTANITFTGAETDTDNNLTIRAESYAKFDTTADASGKDGTASGGTAGVGAGIAVSVFGVDVIAAIADGTPFLRAGTDTTHGTLYLNQLEITAKNTLDETTSAKAGSAGGISATPVLAVHVSGADVQAYLGTPASGNQTLLKIKNDALVSAESAVSRQIAANASAAGGNVGLGGSFAISVVNDSAIARINRSMQAKSVTVHAQSKSTMKSTSRAGANGSPPGGTSSTPSGGEAASGSGDGSSDGSSDADLQADSALSSGKNLSGSVGSNNTNGSSVGGLTSNHQKSQTSEGSIQVAAGFALNIQSNRSEAYIGNETNVILITAEEAVVVEAFNRTDAQVVANASATKAKIGVGVAVSINIVTYTNHAYIGFAAITAGSLRVTASIIEDKPAAASTDTSSTESTNFITNIIKQLIQEAADAMGLGELFSGDTNGSEALSGLLDALAETIGDFVKNLLAGTGLEELIEGDPVEKVNNNIDAFLAALESIPASIKSEINDKLVALHLLDASPDEFLAALKTGITSQLTDLLNTVKTSALESLKTQIFDFVKTHLGELLSSLMPSSGSGGTPPSTPSPLVTELKDLVLAVFDDVKNSLITAVENAISDNIALLGLDVSLDGSTITEIQDAATAQITALFTDKIDELVNTLTEGLVDVDQLTTFLQGNIGETLKTNLMNALAEAGKALTNAAVDALTTFLDVKLKPEEKLAAHTFVTQAVAGAGASNVGIAGAAAIAVIHGDTAA
ncbi:MAG: hypothetical protein GX417_10000, partial [Clostridiales bacterium]|nr:hypothetical protein [Clostridiales bacterium]